jgi:hypothetical protein
MLGRYIGEGVIATRWIADDYGLSRVLDSV